MTSSSPIPHYDLSAYSFPPHHIPKQLCTSLDKVFFPLIRQHCTVFNYQESTNDYDNNFLPGFDYVIDESNALIRYSYSFETLLFNQTPTNTTNTTNTANNDSNTIDPINIFIINELSPSKETILNSLNDDEKNNNFFKEKFLIENEKFDGNYENFDKFYLFEKKYGFFFIFKRLFNNYNSPN